MQYCITCGMPLDDEKYVGAEVADGQICVHCVDSDGNAKSCDDIFEGGVQFFIGAVADADRDLAERLVRKNMNKLPYWQKNRGDVLNGEEATDEEFANAMSKL